ncbi:hypothetical protein PsorP6_001777 [Peronosclerospora sorghi]|uniref:Uncharacterized protein n=1 Tax=Peronosclerospora sorghi TaxID=230839 RepID=A0ACC0WRT3_9STRA|nr:hypothetical protein PsorP6_001777 [Peronosclerospora sorghi]
MHEERKEPKPLEQMEEKRRTRVYLDTFEDKLVDIERKIEETSSKLIESSPRKPRVPFIMCKENKLNLTRLSENLKVTRNKKVQPKRRIDLLEIVASEMAGVTSNAILEHFEIRCRRQQPMTTIEKDPRAMKQHLKLARIKL